MNSDKRKYIYIAIATLLAALALYAAFLLIKEGNPTEMSRNDHLRVANKMHKDTLYEQAIEHYIKALELDSESSITNYNAATNSIMMNYDELKKTFVEEEQRHSAQVDTALLASVARLAIAGEHEENPLRRSSIYHNIGVTLHMADSLQLAAEAYKEVLRKNPADSLTRYNLAVVLYQMKQNQQNQQEQQQEQQEQQEQQQEQQEQQQEQQEQQQEQQEQQQEQQEQQQEEQDKEKENIEQQLKALMQDEKELREKMEDAIKAKGTKSNIEKNW